MSRSNSNRPELNSEVSYRHQRPTQTHSSGWFVIGLFFCSTVGLIGCSAKSSVVKEDAQPTTDSHQRMLEVLETVRGMTSDHHPFLGTRPLNMAKQALERAEGTKASDIDRSQLHGRYGEELLRAGQTKEAIEQTRIALSLIPDDPESATVKSYARYRLAIASLRLGENVNCVHCTNGESCLLPIVHAGVHTDKSGSQQAAEQLLIVLESDPSNLPALWLLNIAHMTLGTYPDAIPEKFQIPPSIFQPEADDILPFRNIASSLKLDTRNPAGGVIIDDFDGDDYLDIVTSTWDPAESIHFFHNNRDGSFTEMSKEAGFMGIFGGLNILQADYDNDGDVDVLVLRGAWLEENGRHPKSLLQNDGHARFRDVTFDAGLADVFYPSQTAAWADYDNDGDLDLYVGNEKYPCQLFENDGKGHFRERAEQAGVDNLRLAKGVTWGDFNRDRWPDIYVSNFPGENRLYQNNRDGTFTDVALNMGVTRPIHSFPTWFWDYNNDGLQDLFVGSFEPGIRYVAADYLRLTIECEPDRLYRGTADGGFDDVTEEVGLVRVTQPMGSNFGDFNNDGWTDFYLGTGYVDYEGLMPNLMFINREGKQFQDVTFAARVGHLQKGHAVSVGDLDNDGDLDIFAQMGGWFAGDAFPNALFENPGNRQNHWIDIRLVGSDSNRSAIGARIRVILEADDSTEERSVYRWVNSGSSFGANPLRQHVGLGKAEQINSVEVYWPKTDVTQKISHPPIDQLIEIKEGTNEFRVVPLKRLQLVSEKSSALSASAKDASSQ